MSLPPVLFVLPQTSAAANGGIVSISHVIAGLRYHRPIIVTDRDSPRVKEWREAGIETYVFPQTASTGFFRNPFATIQSYWRYARELRRLIASSGAKVIHANNPFALQLSLAAVKLTGTKIALNLRDTMDPRRRPPRTRYSLLFAAADHVLYLSQDMANRWREIAPNAKGTFSVTYSIVDPERFRPEPPYAGDGPPVVLLSGVIRPKKGQLEFLSRVSPVLAQRGIETWLAGDFDSATDSYMKACSGAAAPLGNMVKFLGYRTDVPELMRRSAVVAVASRYEGLVRAMIEAMSCARPVVSVDVCSARELLDQESGGAGEVVDVGDYESMAAAIIRYCSYGDAAAAAGARGGVTAARLFARDKVVSRYERVYKALGSHA